MPKLDKNSNWTVTQVWLMLPEHVIGMVVLKSNVDQKVINARTRIRIKPEGSVKFINKNTFKANKLNLNILKNNYNNIDIKAASSNHNPYHKPKADRILFTTDKNNFKKKETYKLSLEVYPDFSKPIQSFKEYNKDDLTGFEISNNNKHFLVIFNPNKESKQLEINERKNIIIYRQKSEEGICQELDEFNKEIKSEELIVIQTKNEGKNINQ